MAQAKYLEWITDDGLIKLTAWARDGLTDEQIAHNMGIATGTLYRWKKEHEEISDALKKGKEVVDIHVENALLKRALGYEYTEVTRERIADLDSELVVTKMVTKEVVPDTTAQIFWLKNRKPDVWRNAPKNATEQEEQEWRIKKLKAETALLEIGEDDSETSIISFLEATRKSKEDVGAVFNDDD